MPLILMQGLGNPVSPLPFSVGSGPVAYDFYVASDGGTGTGDKDHPWSIQYATGSGGGSAQGDGKLPTTGARVAVRGGAAGVQVKYNFSSALGIDAHGVVGPDVDSPVGKLIFEGYRSSQFALPERACLYFTGSNNVDMVQWSANYTWLKDLEMARDWPDRDYHGRGATNAWTSTTNGAKLIGCDLHDGDAGMYSEATVGRGEVYGCWMRNTGFDANSPPGDGGHHLYTHHKGTTDRLGLFENILGSTFNNCCQLYHDGDYAEGIDYTGNVHFNAWTLSGPPWPTSGNQLVVGSQTGGRDIICTDNLFYWPPGYGDRQIVAPWQAGTPPNTNKLSIIRSYAVGGGLGSGCLHLQGLFNTQSDGTFQDNFFRPDTGGRCVTVSQAGASLSYNWSGNTWVRVSTATAWTHAGSNQNWNTFKANSGLGSTDTQQDADPTVTRIFVRPTVKYQAGRGHVIIYNWENLTNIPVDLSSILSVGDNFAVYDNRDPWHSYFTGTYNGSAVSFPNTQLTDPTPIGGYGSTGQAPPATQPFFNAWIVRKTP